MKTFFATLCIISSTTATSFASNSHSATSDIINAGAKGLVGGLMMAVIWGAWTLIQKLFK